MRQIIFAAYMIWLIVNPQIIPLANSYSGESDTLLIKSELDEKIVEAHYFDNKLLINSTNQKSRVRLLSKKSEIYLDKKYDDRYINIFVPENEKSFFVTYQIFPEDVPYYAEIFNVDIFDNEGKLVNCIENISSKFIDITNDGNYFITKAQDSPGYGSDFELYTTSTGSKIKPPFEVRHQTYSARLIDDQTFIVLFPQFKKVKVENDKPSRRKLKREYTSEHTSSIQIIYNFIENKIINQSELITKQGNPLYIVHPQEIPIAISTGRKIVAISCIEKIPGKELHMSAKYLLVSDPYGKRLYETSIPSNSKYDRVKDIKFIDNQDILMFHSLDLKDELVIQNFLTGEKHNVYNFEKNYNGGFDHIAFDKTTKDLYIKFQGHQFLMNGILKFNIEDKNPSFERLDKILVKTQDNTKMFLEVGDGILFISA